MSWDRPAAVAGLAVVCEPVVDAGATFLSAPPGSINPPAILAQYPTTVTLHSPTFGVDIVDWSITAVVGLDSGEQLDALLGLVTDCVQGDPTLDAAVQIATPTEWRNWRILGVSGADYLAADLVLSVRM